MLSCGYIRDSTGEPVVPEDSQPPCDLHIRTLADREKADREEAAKGEVETSGSSVPTDEPFPWTYEGTASSHSSASSDFGVRGVVEYDNERPVTITLNPDGTVDGTLAGGSITSLVVYCEEGDPPPGSLSTTQVDHEPRQLTGTHGDGTFNVIYVPGAPDLVGTYTPSGIQADWENSVSLESCGGTENLHVSGTVSFVLDRTSPPAP